MQMGDTGGASYAVGGTKCGREGSTRPRPNELLWYVAVGRNVGGLLCERLHVSGRALGNLRLIIEDGVSAVGDMSMHGSVDGRVQAGGTGVTPR
jgi:hypothetical protein